MPVTRRQLLRSAASLPLAALAISTLEGCPGSGPRCADPELLSTGEKHMRGTLEYAENTSNAAEQCDGCQFFSTRGGEGDCGFCEILDGDVNRRGYCTSWAARA